MPRWERPLLRNGKMIRECCADGVRVIRVAAVVVAAFPGCGGAVGSAHDSPGVDGGMPAPAVPSGAACDADRCATTLASFSDLVPAAIAMDAANVYWSAFPAVACGAACALGPVQGVDTTGWSGTIASVARAGGAPRTLVPSTNNLGYGAIASDGTSLYWTLLGGGDAVVLSPMSYPLADAGATGAVMKTPVDGGAASSVASDQPYPTGVIADSAGVYWETSFADDNGNVDGAVVALLGDAGAPVAIATGQSGLAQIAFDNTEVVWCANDSGTIVGIQRPAGAATMLAAYFRCNSVAVNGDGVYFSQGPSDSTYAVASNPAKPTTLGPGGLLAADTHALYVATLDGSGPGGYEIVRIDTSGASGAPVSVVTGEPQITAIAVDATNVAWTTWDGNNGAVRILPK